MTSFIANASMSGAVTISKRTTTLSDDQALTVVPFQLAGFEPEPYLIKDGHPDVPALWFKTTTSVSTTGEFYSGDRYEAMDVEIPAQSRFVASDSTWDSVAGLWLPALTSGVNYYWTSVPGLAPFLDEITYLVGKELITTPVLRFTPGDYLISSFNSGIDDAVDVTISFAAMMRSQDAYTIFSTDSSISKISMEVDEQFSFSYAGGAGKVKTPLRPSAMVPVYLVLSISPPNATMYVATGPTKIYSSTVKTKSYEASQMRFLMGKTRLGKATASMNIMEMAIFPYAISPIGSVTTDDDGDVTEQLSLYKLLSLYASIYGTT